MPPSGCARIHERATVKASGWSRASEFKRRRNSPLASPAPRLLAAANPRFRPADRYLMRGNCAETTCAVSSIDPLSIRMISLVKVSLLFNTDSIACTVCAHVLRVTMMAERSRAALGMIQLFRCLSLQLPELGVFDE